MIPDNSELLTTGFTHTYMYVSNNNKPSAQDIKLNASGLTRNLCTLCILVGSRLATQTLKIHISKQSGRGDHEVAKKGKPAITNKISCKSLIGCTPTKGLATIKGSTNRIDTGRGELPNYTSTQSQEPMYT